MGFYGNITNASTTNLVFDKTYGNKYSLMNSIKADNIYLGRYVLVEYDYDDSNNEVYDEYYILNGSSYFYISPVESDDSSLRVKYTSNINATYPNKGVEYGQVRLNQIIKVRKDSNKFAFYKCIGSQGNNYAKFILLVDENVSNYVRNQSIETAIYGEGKGSDSTAWQKIYDNSTEAETYINIANLNSVVPEFNITTDAPSMIPKPPYFNQLNSGGIYYDLHVQPSWGLRVAQAENNERSDGTTHWLKMEDTSDGNLVEKYYDSTDEQWKDAEGVTSEILNNIPAAIYFNKAGFDKNTPSKVTDEEDYISILPTGESGNEYNNYQSAETDTYKDIQEIKISLPSIGNAISDVWDIIYGPQRDSSAVDSLQGKLNSLTNLSENSIPIVKDGAIISGELMGDAWISPTSSNGIINIVHNAPSATTTTDDGEPEKSSEVLSYGAAITVPVIKNDDKGHIFNNTTYTYTLPSISLSSTNQGNVLTELTLDSANGAFTKIYSNVGNLALTGYATTNLVDEESGEKLNINQIQETDTINIGFLKLQNQINTEVSDRDSAINSAISQEIVNRNSAIDSAISQEVSDRNSAIAQEVADRDSAITSAISQEVTNRNSAIGSAITQEVSNRDSAINSALSNANNYTNQEIQKLVYADEDTSTNSYVTKVSQTNGIIEVTKSQFPEIYNSQTKFNYGAPLENGTYAQKTIPDLFGQIYNLESTITNLQKTITDLENRIESLEKSSEQETPTE